MGIVDYLKETRAELRHVAWPTQVQTIVFTILVVLLSVFVSLYLGLFDYIFTGILQRVVGATGASPIEITQQSATSSAQITPIIGTTTKK